MPRRAEEDNELIFRMTAGQIAVPALKQRVSAVLEGEK